MLSLLQMTKTNSLHLGYKGPDSEFPGFVSMLRLASGVQKLAYKTQREIHIADANRM